MPRTKEENIFCITTYLETKQFKTIKQNSAESLTSQLFPEKPILSLGSQISSHRVSKQSQQEGRKPQIWQEVDYKTSR